MTKLSAALSFALAFAAAACDPNASGNVSANKTGDVSNPPATRVDDSTAELAALCGSGDVADSAGLTIQRTPYLQQVTASGADLVWTTTSQAVERVHVTTPDGQEVTTVVAEVDPTAPLPDQARQLVAEIPGLQPSTVYCYEVLDDETVAVGKAGFRTAPLPGADQTSRFIVFGDSGDHMSSDQAALLTELGTVPLDFIVHVGDIAYEDGTLAQFEDSFFDAYGSLLKHFPVFPVAGNHDYHTDDAGPYCQVFVLPNNERWYSYDWGDVHFVAIDTERLGEDQLAWIEADLAASSAPWKIAYMHKPMYSSSNHGSDMTIRGELEPLFQRYGVQLVLAGHDHDYERSKPQDGVVYVVSGGGGRGTYSSGTSDFTAFSVAVIHYLYLEVKGDRLALHAIDATGREFDSLVLAR